MNKWLQIIIGGMAAGATQLGVLYAAGVTQTVPLVIGSVATVGTTIAGLLKQLPQREWTDEERETKLKEKA